VLRMEKRSIRARQPVTVGLEMFAFSICSCDSASFRGKWPNLRLLPWDH
jgi:hypothetical protein